MPAAPTPTRRCGTPPRGRANASLEECVIEYLRARTALLVLDNCEHLLDATARLAGSLLQRCPLVRVIATSREGLAVEGEQVWPLRSLPVPSPDGRFDEHVRAGRDGEQGLRQVQVVRGRDVDDVDLGVGDEEREGGVRPGGPEGVRRPAGSLGAA